METIETDDVLSVGLESRSANREMDAGDLFGVENLASDELKTEDDIRRLAVAELWSGSV